MGDVDTMIISDLHLGDGYGSDDFSYDDFKKLKNAERLLIRHIEYYNPKTIILAGDILELWQHNEDAIRRVYHKFFEFIYDRKSVILRGNHDDTLEDAEDFVVLTLPNGKTVYVAHGHQNDKKMDSPFIRFAVYVFGFIEKILPGLDNIFLGRKNTPIYRKTKKYAEECLKLYDYVVLGHTHTAEQLGNYFNCGTCQGGEFSAVFIRGNMISIAQNGLSSSHKD